MVQKGLMSDHKAVRKESGGLEAVLVMSWWPKGVLKTIHMVYACMRKGNWRASCIKAMSKTFIYNTGRYLFEYYTCVKPPAIY